jgi:hypothetical protein
MKGICACRGAISTWDNANYIHGPINLSVIPGFANKRGSFANKSHSFANKPSLSANKVRMLGSFTGNEYFLATICGASLLG